MLHCGESAVNGQYPPIRCATSGLCVTGISGRSLPNSERLLRKTLPSFACRRSLPTGSPKVAIAYGPEVDFIQLTAAPQLARCRAPPQSRLFG
jgi:hypothetical protein